MEIPRGYTGMSAENTGKILGIVKPGRPGHLVDVAAVISQQTLGVFYSHGIEVLNRRGAVSFPKNPAQMSVGVSQCLEDLLDGLLLGNGLLENFSHFIGQMFGTVFLG